VSALVTDDQLDALARDLPPARVDAARLEDVRTALLAAAAEVSPKPVRTFGRRSVVVVTGALAAAAAIAIWVAVDREAPEAARSRATLTPGADAELSQVAIPPDEIVHLRQGTLAVELAALGRGERFRVITSDAELEARLAHFVVAADHGTLQRIDVVRGELELRPRAGVTTTLRAGERWAAVPVETAAVPAPPVVAAVPAPAAPAPRDRPVRSPRESTAAPVAPSEPVPPAIATPGPPPAPAPPSAPGEAEFRTGWEALRTGDARRAAVAFAASHAAAGRGAVAEDARYWEGIALARAGQASEAIAAMRRFLAAHPASSRAGEASARLGWLQLDAGQLDGAERSFTAAAADRVPAVRRSASKGLEKLRALRDR
jgi:TolA-binding protein